MRIPGDIDSVRAVSRLLDVAARALSELAFPDDVPWHGVAHDAWVAQIDARRRQAREMATALAAVARALHVFAEALHEAQLLADRASALAADACLVLSPDGSVPTVEIPPPPYETDDAARRAAVEMRRAAVRADVVRLAAVALERADDAHRGLVRHLGGIRPDTAALAPPGWIAAVDTGHALLLAPAEVAGRAGDVALLHRSRVTELRRALRQAPASRRALAREALQAEKRALRSAEQTAARWGRVADRFAPVVRPLAPLGAPLHTSVPVLRHVPVLSLPLGAATVALDMRSGSSAAGAIAKNVTSGAAGIAATGGVAWSAAALGVTATAAPVVLGIAAGAVVGYGVGLAVDEWGDDVVGVAKGAVRQVFG